MKQELSKVYSWLQSQEEKMKELLIDWSETNTGSYNLEGIQGFIDKISPHFSQLDGTLEVLPAKPVSVINHKGKKEDQQVGEILRIRKRPSAKTKILLCGHMDTVFQKDHPFQKTSLLTENRLNGPGVADLKGGILVVLYSLLAFEKFLKNDDIGWEVLLNSDEEIGSHGSDHLLKEAAEHNDVGFIYEPTINLEGLHAGQRKGSGTFTWNILGKSSHVGRAFQDGRSATVALGKLIPLLDDLNQKNKDIILNVGLVNGGGPLNMVPHFAQAKVNVRVESSKNMDWVFQEFDQIRKKINQLEGIETEYLGSFSRPPKMYTTKSKLLYDFVQSVASTVDIDMAFQDTGGCCDGNNLLNHGLTNIDTMGVRGQNIHSEKEMMALDSLVERTFLTVHLLQRFSEDSDLKTKFI